MYIVLIRDGKVVEKIECTSVEISTGEEPNIKYDDGVMLGVKPDIYILDESTFDIGEDLTESELAALNNRKNEFIRLSPEEELQALRTRIQELEDELNKVKEEPA